MKIRIVVVVAAVLCLTVAGLVLSKTGAGSGDGASAPGVRLASQQEQPLAAVLSPDSSAPVADVAASFPQSRGARVADALPDGTKILALHGTRNDPGKVCVLELSATKPRSMLGACDSVAHFNEAGVVAIVGSTPNERLVGLVPDGVDTVTLRLKDGSSASARVHNNTYSFSPQSAPESLTFAGSKDLAPRTLS